MLMQPKIMHSTYMCVSCKCQIVTKVIALSQLTISSMAIKKLTSLIVLELFCITIMDCDSISPAIPPILPSPSPNPYPVALIFSPSYEPSPGPSLNLESTSSESYPLVPGLSSPIPAPKSIGYLSSNPYPFYPFPLPRGIKAAYWPSGNGFPASSIDTLYFTHIYYAFLLPEPATFKLNITTSDQEKLPEFTGALRARNPPVKTLLSIGGGGNDPIVFSKMASNESTRAIFINSTIEVARKYGFDGVDLDWEFPGNHTDMFHLALLYKQWCKALEREAKATKKTRLLLTSAVYYASKITLLGKARTYPGNTIRKYVDWVSPMCFDYHGSWERVTGEHSALDDPNSNISTTFGIQSWIQVGVPPKKLVMGLPLYGRTWTLQDPKVNGIGAPAVGPGPGGGVLVYSQILDFNTENNATVKFDKQSSCFYSYAGGSWVGYDDVGSVKLKVQFALARSLGGYFFWALGQDKDWTISREASNAWGH